MTRDEVQLKRFERFKLNHDIMNIAAINKASQELQNSLIVLARALENSDLHGIASVVWRQQVFVRTGCNEIIDRINCCDDSKT